MADKNKTSKVGGRALELSNTDKVFFPEDKISKGDIIDYYRRIAEIVLSHMKDRPLSMQRFPDGGIEAGGFCEKVAPDHFPDWIERATVGLKKEKGSQLQIVCNNAATLIYFADQACLTPHIWLSCRDKLDYPDRMVFDLDPPSDDFEEVRSRCSPSGWDAGGNWPDRVRAPYRLEGLAPDGSSETKGKLRNGAHICPISC